MTQSIERLDPNFAVREADSDLLWYDARRLGVEGRGFTETKAFYNRLPAAAEGIVREPVWGLQQHSAGMYVRFVTDAPAIGVRWTLRFESLAMSHMPASGVSGVDLYMSEDGAFRWVGIGIPKQFPKNTAELQGSIDGQGHLFMLYLPLYNGVESVHLGVPEDRTLTMAPVDARPPMCFYGTSIVQGGCAVRAGMNYPAILQRRLNQPVLNFGFSGNGQAEPEVAELLGELDPSVYVLDPLPNLSPELVTERIEPFARILRRARPDTPIVFVENIIPTHTWRRHLGDPERAGVQKNTCLQAAYRRLLDGGMNKLHLVPGDNLFGDDFESTVDGLHPTDLGFMRMADVLEPVLQPLVSSHARPPGTRVCGG